MAEILAMSCGSLRRLILRPRFFVSLVLAFGCVWLTYSDVPPYLAARGYQLQAAEPFLLLLPSVSTQILLLISFLLLVGDVPFLYPGLETTAMRSSKRKWLAAQLLAALGAALLWLLLVLVFTLLPFGKHLSLKNEWSVLLKSVARTGVDPMSLGMRLIDGPGSALFARSTPYLRLAEAFLLQALLLWSLTLWSLAFNLWTRRSYGCMLTVGFWVLRLNVTELELRYQRDMTVISPFDLVDLCKQRLTLARAGFIVLFFLLQICVLWLLSALRLRRTDLTGRSEIEI